MGVTHVTIRQQFVSSFSDQQTDRWWQQPSFTMIQGMFSDDFLISALAKEKKNKINTESKSCKTWAEVGFAKWPLFYIDDAECHLLKSCYSSEVITWMNVILEAEIYTSVKYTHDVILSAYM